MYGLLQGQIVSGDNDDGEVWEAFFVVFSRVVTVLFAVHLFLLKARTFMKGRGSFRVERSHQRVTVRGAEVREFLCPEVGKEFLFVSRNSAFFS